MFAQYHQLPPERYIWVLRLLLKISLNEFKSVREIDPNCRCPDINRILYDLHDENLIEHKVIEGPFPLGRGYDRDKNSYKITLKGIKVTRAINRIVKILKSG